MRIKFEDLRNKFESLLISRGFSQENAHKAATVFAQSSADGIYSHGVNRFPRVIYYLDKGLIQPNALCEKISSFGSLERWDGKLGLGPLNASICMERACELAKEYGIGIVALSNTNHWMRGGSYGWQAANNGCIGICWTNTTPNMPAWGGKNPKIGNNPFIISIPRSGGAHVVLDCAMSQFAYGKIEEARMKGQKLPVPGGYDTENNMTTDPAEIEKTGRVLPMGYWKGSGMSIVLDLAAAVLSGGNSCTEIGKKYEEEIALSQIMIAIDPSKMDTKEISDSIINTVIEDIKQSEPISEGGKIFYPGEREYLTRQDNMENGIPVLEEVWEKINALEK
ncbi:3-dehydro-L-gulonate 2-dehydrogenase [Anaerocolumna sp.]|uniref:3-dehydro-L-gulonate 2-dehydrogenase n=1 Tax=Anaerocolumna sp. TaxID=2041569 RepID=UPI0028A7A535|nr:3-dehydro-L-gulonate 2-dehydrogenase [Anaerocolumna sp.]